VERRSLSEHVLSSFLETMAKPDVEAGVLCCYGKLQTSAALAMGAVEVLLVASDCARYGLSLQEWRMVAKAHGTMVLEIEDRSEDGTHFCKAFGIGGCLRWPVDPELFEETEAEFKDETLEVVESELHSLETDIERNHEGNLKEDMLTEYNDFNYESERGGTVTGPKAEHITVCDNIIPWLGNALHQALGDESAAEALTVCVEVILADDSADRSDALAQAASMLLAEGIPQHIVDEMVLRAK